MMQKGDIRILIVEDEEIIRNMFKISFEKWGFLVDTAEDGKFALEKCQMNTYQIVVTDLNMPFMNGMELLKKIKSKWPYIEVIVITGFATIEAAIEAMKLGAHDFILKPVNFDHVQFTINKCYQKLSAQAENEELREINAKLMELNELKDKFMYITNHEIRTPLSIMKGYMELLKAFFEDPSEEVEEIFKILENTNLELSEMLERMHMLDGGNQYQPNKKLMDIDLKDLLRKIYKEISVLFNCRKIDLKILVSPDPLIVEGDKRQMRLILRELIQNALKFTEDGGKVHIRLESKNDQIIYSVQDSGIGIPLDKQDMIFESFYEVQDSINHSSSKKDFMGGGLGIGLSLVRDIVNSMNGKIMIESEPDLGTTFKILLPSKKEQLEKINVLS